MIEWKYCTWWDFYKICGFELALNRSSMFLIYSWTHCRTFWIGDCWLLLIFLRLIFWTIVYTFNLGEVERIKGLSPLLNLIIKVVRGRTHFSFGLTIKTFLNFFFILIPVMPSALANIISTYILYNISVLIFTHVLGISWKRNSQLPVHLEIDRQSQLN